ncbi:MAG: MraY family glycosyltransferase [Pseudomonadota bacterium]
MSFIFTFLAAMIVSMMLLPPLIVLGRRFQFVDQPSPRKVHATPIPRIGGLAIAGALFAALLTVDWSPLSARYIAMLLAGTVVLVVGAIDDRHELGYRTKFIAQFIAAIIAVYGGGLVIEEITLFSSVTIPAWIGAPLTVFCIVAIANAVALSDGLDGLAGGIVFICCAALAVLGYSVGNVTAALVAAGLAGAIFGFLRFNTHPAVIFMGDSGSQFLGVMSALLAIDVTQSEPGRIAAALPLLLLAVPVLDTVQVMISRVMRGKSAFKPDKYHMHHRLLRIGLKHHEAVLAIYLVQCLFFLAAFFFRFESDLILVALLLFAGGAFVFTVILLGNDNRGEVFKRRTKSYLSATRRNALGNLVASLVMCALLVYVVLLYGANSTLSVSPGDSLPGIQTQQLALVLIAAVIASCLLMSKPKAGVFNQTVGYVVAAMLAFSASATIDLSSSFAMPEFFLLALIGLANVTWLLVSDRRESQMTTLDVLILFSALVVPNLPILADEIQSVATLILRLVCLFYAVEVTAAVFRSSWFFRALLLASLGLLAINRPFTDLSFSLSNFATL